MEKLMKKLDKMDPEERGKLHSLLKEDNKPKAKGATMDWMYKEDKPDREEYLLGRRIDKYIEGTDKEESKDTPGASFKVDDDVLARRAEMDMQAKMREDPLYAIHQKEEEAKRRLLQNPIRLKQLQQLIEQKDKKKKDKKNKKKKKHRHSSESDSDSDILKQYLSIVQKKKSKDPKESSKPSKHDDKKHRSKDEDHRRESHKHHHRSKTDESDEESRNEHRDTKSFSDADDHSRRRHGHHDRHQVSSHSYGLVAKDRNNEFSTSKSSSKDKRASPDRHDYHQKRSSDRSVHKSERSTERRRSRSPARKEPKKKLTSAEMEKRRAEMLQNATWRDDQRKTNVDRYHEEDAREKKNLETAGTSRDFLNPMLMKHANQSSVEERIKRNIYNLQRTNKDMDKKFTDK